MLLGSFHWGSRVLERSSTGVSGKFQWCFKGVSRKFSISFNFKKFSRVFQESFKGVSRTIEGHSRRVLSGFQGYLKEIQREFQ